MTKTWPFTSYIMNKIFTDAAGSGDMCVCVCHCLQSSLHGSMNRENRSIWVVMVRDPEDVEAALKRMGFPWFCRFDAG